MAEKPWTMSVPAAGKKYYGLSRNGSYDAAARGDLLTVRVGRLLKVQVAAQERKLKAVGQAPSANQGTKSARAQRHESDTA